MASILSFPQIHFDFGAIKELTPELNKRKIDRPLVITDQGLVEHGVYDKLLSALPSNITVSLFDRIPENPTIIGVDQALEVYQRNNCNGIIGLGGGSVLDSGKALRVIATQDVSIIDILNNPDKIRRSALGASGTFGRGGD